MKKAFICLCAATLFLTACNRDEEQDTGVIVEPTDLTVQNANDDRAIAKYMDEHYLDAQGKVKRFSATDTSDDNFKKLTDLNPQKLSSGVVVIVREGAQPDPGAAIGTTDIIRLMHSTTTFLSNNENSNIVYASEYPFANTIDGSGVPQVDPQWYYVKEDVLKASGKTRSFYEIEGFQEGLKYFKSYDKADSEGYNLQGVILVPSRAAFARDEHSPYNGINWRNRNFVFNFQVYKTTAR